MKRVLFILILSIFLISILPHISSAGEVTYCCEETVKGAFCQSTQKEDCKQNVRQVPTSCEATNYCKLGCCYDSTDGTCMENTPQVVCSNEGGVWNGDSASCDIPQCQLGCCLIGSQAAFVTQTRCKRLSALYGLETNYRSDIYDEVSCIASTTTEEMGACVYEFEFERTCKMITQSECDSMKSSYEGVKFYSGVLCTAEDLGTVCGPTKDTTCVEGRDEVYFVDTCGNVANIYDADRTADRDREYWTKMFDKSESCDYEEKGGNANDGVCGNCDYYYGSTCKKYDRNKDRTNPRYGEYICRDLACDEEGKDHGETWCVSNTNNLNTPGSEYFRKVCYNGEVTIEPCAAFRSEICIEAEILEEGQSSGDGFSVAACTANRWQDCLAQEDEDDCLNTDKRDCEWIYSGIKKYNEDSEELENVNVCVPKYAPGFDFWDISEDSDSEEMCAIASSECVAKFERKLDWDDVKDLVGDPDTEYTWYCKENCHCCTNGKDEDGNTYKDCTGENYVEYKKNFCTALGDCGPKRNYVGQKGFNFDDDNLICNGGDCYWTL